MQRFISLMITWTCYWRNVSGVNYLCRSASIIFAGVLTHLRMTLPGIVIPIQSSIVISNHLLTEDYFISIVTSFVTSDIVSAISHV